ncbi:sugar ABC transporter permease [Salinisphaera sp. USBA-960]|nr:sugar ABC transporter permease [Salifodinibacter halophilus]NNC26405.1 sugar ABC transporter permease [Salifodinibacter halophilus]
MATTTKTEFVESTGQVGGADTVRPPLRQRLEPWFFVAPSLILLLMVGLFPIVYTGYFSFHDWTMGFGTPSFSGLSNYIEALTTKAFGLSVARTLVLLAITLPVQLALGMAIALALDAPHNPFLKRLLQICLVIPIAVTPAVIGLLAQLMFNQQFGIINYLIGLVGIGPVDWLGGSVSAFATVVIVQIWEWTPFVALVLSASLATVPKDIEEAAMLETARWWPRFKSVVLPYMWPGITAALVFQTAFTVKAFGMIYSIAKGGPGGATRTAMLHIERVGFRGFDVGLASAESVLMLVMSIVLAQIYIKAFYRDS